MSEPFKVVLADPPWQYRDRVGPGFGFGADRIRGRRGAAGYYPTMSVEQICDLYAPSRVNGTGSYSYGRIARHPIAHDAHLYLWATNAFMEQAHQVAIAWCFTPRTILTWIKPRIGMGHYYRNTTEHVIFAVRGKLPTLRKDQPTHFEAPVGRHSEKPQRLYEIIESMSPGPWLELFARRQREGWVAWGDELEVGDPAEPPLPFVEALPEPPVSWT